MTEANRFELITIKREQELAKEIKKGNTDAVHELIEANLRFVVAIAMDYSKLGTPLDELISEGNIGLMHAAGKYEPDKGAKFSTYAAWWIKQRIRKTISENNKLIRIPVSSMRKILIINKTRSKLTILFGRTPTDEELADETELSVDVVKRLKDADAKICSLHAPLYDGDQLEVGDLIVDRNTKQPDDLLSMNDVIEHMLQILPILPERYQHILTLRFGLNGEPPQTLDTVGKSMNLTRERVRQIEMKSLKKLRRVLEDEEYAKKTIKLHNIKIPQ